MCRERRACRLEQPAVGHAARAGGLAAATPETPIEMLPYDRIVRRDRPIEERPHQQQAPARGVVLVVEREISRTGGETEAAVDAGVEARTLLLDRKSVV